MGKPLRFLVDDTLRGLARKLRMIGYDTVERDGGSWWVALAKAKHENRVVVTLKKDLRVPPEVKMWMIHAEKTNQQVQELITRIPTDVDPPKPLSRCLVCNQVVAELPVKDALSKVPPLVAQNHTKFLQCPDCHRIYWAGSHVRKMSVWMQAWGIDEKLGINLRNLTDSKE